MSGSYSSYSFKSLLVPFFFLFVFLVDLAGVFFLVEMLIVSRMVVGALPFAPEASLGLL